MVKNLPTVERSTKIRFGKNCTNDQAENTIVFNASEAEIDTPFTDSVYITPLRLRTDLSDRNISVLAYNQVTKEMMDSGAVAEDILNFTLEAAVINGNVTSNIVSFNNAVTSATTLSNVGISNSSPTDTLSVGSKVFVNQTASNTVRILGSTYIQNNLVVDGDATFNGLVTTLHSNNTVIRDAILEIGKDNVVGDASLDLGFVMTRPGSNIAVGYLESSNEFAIGYTQSSANHHTITPLTTQDINVHVYGQIFTESNVGVMNTNPVHTLDVGSNLFVDEFGSNILVVTGNTSISADLTVDGDTLFVDSGVDKVGINTLTPSAELHVVGNAYISSNLTVDTNTLHVDVESNRVGINQINPTKDLDVNGTIAATRRVDNSGYDRLLIGTDTGATIHPSSNAHLISLGYRAGYDRQHSNSIAIGYKSGSVTQAESSIAIGERSGETNQGNSSIAIGEKAAYENQAASSIAIGENAGGQDQLGNSIAIGKDAGSQNQGQKSIAIGDGAGKFNQGEGAIAIGYYAGYPTGQAAGSVIINGGTDAAGFNNTTTQNALFINPVRNVNNSNILMYNADSKEFTYGTTIHNTVNVSNNFTVDTDTLFVDSVNDSVGINNASPDANLHVVGNVYVSSNLTVDLNTLHVDTNKHFVGIETNFPDATLHVVGNTYILNDLTVDTDTFHVDSVNESVGVGTVSPDANLHVVGNVYVSSNLTVDTDTLHVDSVNHSIGIETKTPDANLHVVGNTYVSSNLTVDTDTLHVDSVTHSVGIETKTPDANLHVVGNVYVSSNLTVDTDTLHVDSVSHSVGIETKTPDANLHVVGNTYISSNLTVDTNTLHVDVGNKSVGLGTVTPSAELHVVGNVFVTSNVSIADTTATSSKTTGALKVGGGLGVAGDIHATNTYFEDATANSILVTDTTVTSSKTTGALRVSGGLGVVGDIHATNTYFEDATANSILVTDTTVTSSKTTGALIVTGGLGITGAIHGSAVNVEGVEADSLHVTDTTSTTSKTTGAVRLAGGLGVAGNIHATHVNFEDVVADSLTIEDTTLSTSKTTGAVIVAGGIGVTDNVYASRFVGDGGLLSNIATNLQSISENGNTTSNIIQFTGTETSFVSHSNVGIANTEPNHTLSVGTNFYVNEDGANTVVVDGNVSVSSNLTLGSNIAIVGLSVDKFPIVGSTKFLEDSIITKSGPDRVISGGLQVTGNIFQTGNVFVVDSNNTVIQDRILTLANNNTQTALDVGIIMEYPGHNIAIAHHGDESPERLSIGYTLNKHTDTQIDADSNTITLDVLGNLQVQNDFTVDTSTFHVDSVTNRVGVLTAAPAYTLDVHGNSNVAVARSKSSVVTDGTDSGSKTTGAVTIIGGLGVGKNIHAKDVNFEAATLDSATIQNVTSTTNKTSGALIVGGGIGVAGNIHASNVNFEDAEIDSLTVTDGTPTNSKTSGAVKIAGGLGVVGAIHGSTVNFEGAEVDNLTVTDTTISTSTGSGAVTVAGGIGVSGNVYAAKFYGDGSTLTGLVTRLEDVTNNGNTTSNTIQFNNNQSLYDTSFVTTGKVGIKTATPVYDLQVTGNSYISSNVTVDTNTFHVDAVNNKVGVGTTEPDKTLHVQGDIKFTGTLFEDDAPFVTSPWVTTGSDIYYNVGNVGFGTNANVDANVHVNGNVYVSSNIHAGPNANQTSFLGRAAIGYNGSDDNHATFAHFGHNSSTNFALKQTASGPTHLNTPSSQHIRFSVHNEEKMRITGVGDLKVGSNILYVDASEASVGLGTATPSSNLHVVGNAYVSSNLTVGNNVYVTGGLITNTGGVTKKTYSLSRTVGTGITPLVDINFTSNIFYAKITAQLIDDDEDLSTMILEVSGGRKSGETPTKNIAVGTKNIFGDQTNTNPWSPTVTTTGNKVTLTTSNALDSGDGYDIFIEYMSSNSNGGVVSVAESGTTIETFGY
jgi:enhancing lycopene biosynthesis protein 2